LLVCLRLLLPSQLNVAFPIKYLGKLAYFLGVKVTEFRWLILAQKKYAHNILHHTNMKNCKSVSTKMCTHENLSTRLGNPLGEDEVFAFRRTVGALK
jgi:hypothetical protein